MIEAIDHLVITTADPQACLAFYRSLGFSAKDPGGRYELYAGNFKINVHVLSKELSPHAERVQPGSADLCFTVNSVDAFAAMLADRHIAIELGIVPRNGARGPMRSVYLRDPDGNLLEFCSYS